MENYEQKYKAALNCMRNIYPTLQGTDREDAEHYFPELKESEDERIRKGLIKGLSAMRDIHKRQTFSDDAINIDDAIAWLENQGEQNSAWSEEDELALKQAIYVCHQNGYTAVENWLKSLKPNHWKPSDEQMNDLYYASKQLSVTRPSLKTLYEDLKAL